MRTRLLARLRLTEEAGMTLVELVIAMSILSIAMVVLLSSLTSVEKATVNEDVRSRTIDQARLALQSIDRQVRSGNLLYPPNGAGYTFLLYTQAYAAQDDTSRCAMWTITSQNQLVYADWPPLTPAGFTATWQVVAEGIMNRTDSQSAFTLDPTGRTMTVSFFVDANTADGANASSTQELQTSVTGRNTSFGYPLQVCANMPTNVPS